MIKAAQIKKDYMLLAVGIVLLVICYQLAFRKTIEAWHLHRQLTGQLAQSTGVSFQPGYSERKDANISRLLSLYKADTVNFRSNIISRIASIAEKENVKLSEVPVEDRTFNINRVFVQKLAFEGDYFSLIKTLNELQKASGIGTIRSVDLKEIENRVSANPSKKLLLVIQLVNHS